MKIPFERTIAGAYRFAFSNILSVIGVCWFPYLLLCGLVGGFLYLQWPQIQEFVATVQTAHGPDPSKIQSFLRLFLALYGVLIPAFIIVDSMVTVGVMRKALGQHPSPVFAFFSLGSQVWRLVGAYFLLGLLFYGVAIVLAAAVGGIWAALNKYVAAAATPVTVILGIIAGLWCIYALVRTYFFLPAVVVAENHLGLRRSWHLGYGNFWRIFGIFLITYLPVAFAAQIVLSTIVQLSVGPIAISAQTGASAQKVAQEIWPMLFKIAPYYFIVQVIQMILLTGLKGGAIAGAYKAVTGGTDAKAAA
jgi:hypothetical protein